MSDRSDSSAPPAEPNPEPPSSTGGRPEEGDRQQSERWFDRLLAAVGLRSSSLRRELEETLEHDPGGAFSAEERTLLANILRLRDVRVEDIMVPRAEIEAIETGESLGKLIGRFRESGHSRMPVYRDSLDEPIGMVHIKDVVRAMAHPTDGEAEPNGDLDLTTFDLEQTIEQSGLTREVLFVPPSMPVATLLTMMQGSRMQMALVIDEHGGTDGLVSIEDAVEAIVGEIEDEHDEIEHEIIAESDGVFVADAGADLEDVAAAIGGELAGDGGNDEIETIGGKVFSLLGRIPAEGEKVTLPEGHEVEILDADQRRIRRVRIRVGSAAEDTDNSLPRAASSA